MLIKRPGSVLPLALLLVAVAAIYSGVLSNGYVWDDLFLYVDNADLRAGPLTWELLSRPVIPGSTYFRPVVLLSFALEFNTWGVVAFISHAINLATHLVNIALVYFLAVRLLGARQISSRWRAGVAAAFFALHPSMIEAAGWVSGRFDLMVTTFALAALLADATIARRSVRTFSVVLFFSLALGCKELAVMLPPMLLCQRLARRTGSSSGAMRCILEEIRADWPTVAGMSLVLLMWLWLRHAVFGVMIYPGEGGPLAIPLTEHVLLVLNALYFYGGEIALPFTSVGPYHLLPFDSLTDRASLVRAGIALAVVVAVAGLVYRRTNLGMQLTCALLALLPVSYIVPLNLGGSIGADRYLTLPLAFAALGLCALPSVPGRYLREHVSRLCAGAIAGAWVLMSVICIYVTVPLWRNEFTLWTWVDQDYPDFEPAQINLISAAIHDQRYEVAHQAFQRLLAAGPLTVKVQRLYAKYLFYTGRADEAERAARGVILSWSRERPEAGIAIAQPPDRNPFKLELADAHNTLGLIMLQKRRFRDAERQFETAMLYSPGMPFYRFGKSLALLAMDRVDEGEHEYANAMNLATREGRLALGENREDFIEKLCATEDGARKAACNQLPNTFPERDALR